MVEYGLQLDSVFRSLADPTRRDIFKRVNGQELTIGEIAACYKMSFAAVSKHLKIMEQAKLIRKRREGRNQYVIAKPATLKSVQAYLDQYRRLWDERFDALEAYINKEGE